MQPVHPSDSCTTEPRLSLLCDVQHAVKAEKPQHSDPSQSEKPELDQEKQTINDEQVPLHSVMPNGEKTFVIIAGSFAALISPLSSSIYLPALPSLASDMNVSVSLINLTITTYLVMSTEPSRENMELIICRYSKDSHLLSSVAFQISMDAVLHISLHLLSTSERILASLCKTPLPH